MALALDVAASEFYVKEKKAYVFKKSDGRSLSGSQMVEFYRKLVAAHIRLSRIEDGCSENDWDTWKKLTDAIGDQVAASSGDDLFVTNTEFLKKGHRDRHRQLDPGQGQTRSAPSPRPWTPWKWPRRPTTPR